MKTFREIFLTKRNLVKADFSYITYKLGASHPDDLRKIFDNVKEEAYLIQVEQRWFPICYLNYSYRKIIYENIKNEKLKIDLTSIIPTKKLICFRAYYEKIRSPFYFIMYKSTISKSKVFSDEFKLLMEIGL